MREETFRAVLDRRRAQPEDARLQEHHLHRRQRRQSGRPARRRRGAQQAVRTATPIVAHVQEYYTYARRRRATWRRRASRKARATTCTTIRSSRSTCSSPIRSRSATTSASRRARRRINGVDISDRAKATELAKKIVEFRAQHTVDAIKKAIANKGTLPGADADAAVAVAAGGTGAECQRPDRRAQARHAACSHRTVARMRRVSTAAPDPRSMGGGDCAQQSLQLRRHAESAAAAPTRCGSKR